jgi:hypothetical protein
MPREAHKSRNGEEATEFSLGKTTSKTRQRTDCDQMADSVTMAFLH